MPGRQLEKIYDPTQVEERWYRFWTEKGYFHATVDRPGAPYSIVIPPPNITGSLHLGHALNNTLQDILIRWRRMQGRNTLWMPGTDHAGIATQNVVERQLLAEGTSREVLGREAFVKRVWDWKAQSGGSILQQLKRLGASCDWDRLRFTIDEGLSQAVREVFVRLHEEPPLAQGVHHESPSLVNRLECEIQARIYLSVVEPGCIHLRPLVQDRYSRQVVPLARLEIVEVMPGGDLDGSRAEFPVHQDRITNDRNVARR